MRRRWLLVGLGGVMAGAGAALGQFAADRTPPPANPAPAPTAQPTQAGQLPSYPATPPPQAPAGRPVSYAAPPEQQQAPRPAPSPNPALAHPLYVRPEHGGWMIVVKSYSGDGSQKFAEELAAEIRQTHKAAAWLFEWGGEERRHEEQRRDEVRQRYRKEYEPFLQVKEELRAKAAQQGTEFLDTPATFRLPTVNYTEQWAVLVGGFKDMDAARAALNTVRTWPAPKNTALLDKALVAGGGAKGEGTYLNPFPNAFVVPNPSVRRSDPNQAPLADPAIVKLNEAEPLSLLQARKPWTLLVKRFIVPNRVTGTETQATALERLFSEDTAAKWLELTARQARELATALRHEKMRPHPFETYVLHARTESVVTVGQFDGPDDPALVQAYQELAALTFRVDYKDGRPSEVKKMFDAITPMRVPRVQ